ncbi:MAG: hypothetical protein WCL32_09425 [Planctomycetota bacterium]
MKRLIAILGPAFLFALGCGSPGEVAGKVTFNGKPVVIGTVLILASDSLPYSAPLSETGEFAVPKVPAGKALVAVVSRNPALTRPARPRPGKADTTPGPAKDAVKALADKWFPIPERFSQLEQSGLELTVKPGSNLFDIGLTAAKK